MPHQLSGPNHHLVLLLLGFFIVIIVPDTVDGPGNYVRWKQRQPNGRG